MLPSICARRRRSGGRRSARRDCGLRARRYANAVGRSVHDHEVATGRAALALACHGAARASSVERLEHRGAVGVDVVARRHVDVPARRGRRGFLLRPPATAAPALLLGCTAPHRRRRPRPPRTGATGTVGGAPLALALPPPSAVPPWCGRGGCRGGPRAAARPASNRCVPSSPKSVPGSGARPALPRPTRHVVVGQPRSAAASVQSAGRVVVELLVAGPGAPGVPAPAGRRVAAAGLPRALAPCAVPSAVRRRCCPAACRSRPVVVAVASSRRSTRPSRAPAARRMRRPRGSLAGFLGLSRRARSSATAGDVGGAVSDARTVGRGGLGGRVGSAACRRRQCAHPTRDACRRRAASAARRRARSIGGCAAGARSVSAPSAGERHRPARSAHGLWRRCGSRRSPRTEPSSRSISTEHRCERRRRRRGLCGARDHSCRPGGTGRAHRRVPPIALAAASSCTTSSSQRNAVTASCSAGAPSSSAATPVTVDADR